MTRSAIALVALSAGEGLGTAEIATRRVGHLRVDEQEVLWVDVSDIRGECFAPEVPVSVPCADDLRAISGDRVRDFYLVTPENDGAVRHRVLHATVKHLNATAAHGTSVDRKALR